MSKFGLSLVVGGVVLAGVGFTTAVAGVTVNSDVMIFGGGVVTALGLGLIVSGFYTIWRGIFKKIDAIAKVLRYMAVEKEEVEVGKKK